MCVLRVAYLHTISPTSINREKSNRILRLNFSPRRSKQVVAYSVAVVITATAVGRCVLVCDSIYRTKAYYIAFIAWLRVLLTFCCFNHIIKQDNPYSG